MDIVDRDPWLEPYRAVIDRREHHYGTTRHAIDQDGGLLGPISQGHLVFGFLPTPSGLLYREWAPGATQLCLTGEFNDWNPDSHPMSRDDFGVWSIFLPKGTPQPTHGSKAKVLVDGFARIPAYIRRVVQEEDNSYSSMMWDPEPFRFQNSRPQIPSGEGLRIYEAHVGMATSEGKVGSFEEFRQNVLPRVQDLGFNALQLMAIQEHPYYGSFGYHVSSFYAVSSRFGTPEDLKRLIDDAHGRGILVFLDLIHSHSVKNLLEGIWHFDGTDHQYFHAGARGLHSGWDSALFDYSKYEVQRFLLSNVRYWIDEFRFDGFRFDGVTSMLYHHHGIGKSFTSLDDYFGGDVDDDALLYLKLANEVAHAVLPQAVTIAEDVSGLPGLARPVSEKGIGFDYRLSMGIPNMWFSLIKKEPDEAWSLGTIWGTLQNRRRDEKQVAYVESHDEAIVGDKTLAFSLMDSEMYEMQTFRPSPVLDRGVALHKMIRLLTVAAGGEAYLTFMGNEFGHPEWIDFPREGNGFSYHYARRLWYLTEDEGLRFAGLNRFEKAMLGLDRSFGVLNDPLIDQLSLHEGERVLVFRRGPLVFGFNFHASASYEGFRIPLPEGEDYVLALSTDEEAFGGHGRVDPAVPTSWLESPMHGWPHSGLVYLPSRSASVWVPARLRDAVRSSRIS